MGLREGSITLDEVSYILHPTTGTQYAVKGLLTQAGMDLHDATPINIGKRPYDWILESQWQRMLVRGSTYMCVCVTEKDKGRRGAYLSHNFSEHTYPIVLPLPPSLRPSLSPSPSLSDVDVTFCLGSKKHKICFL